MTEHKTTKLTGHYFAEVLLRQDELYFRQNTGNRLQ